SVDGEGHGWEVDENGRDCKGEGKVGSSHLVSTMAMWSHYL
ncbi:hypothetical protein A2U01_0082627, partial [Trifolium medium]|nr:hypothetical protein [Trifolium medium]